MKCGFVIKKFLIVFIAALFCCLCCSMESSNLNEENIKSVNIGEKRTDRATYDEMLVDIYNIVDGRGFAEEGKSNLKKVESYDVVGAAFANGIFDYFEDPKNFDYIDSASNTIAAGINAVAACYGLGGISEMITGSIFGDNVVKDKYFDDIKSTINKQMDSVVKNFEEIQREISALSKTVTESTNTILDALYASSCSSYAREKVINFFSNEDGNFSFTQFKNYLYGSTKAKENPLYYGEAYYSILFESIVKNADSQVLKQNYDDLYRNLVLKSEDGDTNINKFYTAITENFISGKKSIQQYYYEYLLSNKELLVGRSAEYEAIQFTLDLYQTAVFADYCIDFCLQYQENAMIISKVYELYGKIIEKEDIESYNIEFDGKEKYRYGSGDKDFITYDKILESKEAIKGRRKILNKQMIADFAYILNLGGSVTIKDVDGEMRIMSDKDTKTFGQVKHMQTVYLNTIPMKWVQFFDADINNFRYIWKENSEVISTEEKLCITNYYKNLFVEVYYEDNKLYSINFEIENDEAFSGGSGTVNNPYIISEANQSN